MFPVSLSVLFHVPAASDLQKCMLRGTYGCYESRPGEWLTFGLQRFVMWRDAFNWVKIVLMLQLDGAAAYLTYLNRFNLSSDHSNKVLKRVNNERYARILDFGSS
ncbi:hypothetical protein TNIN_299331 [Trichonephila inaurata madagascariensis]|uniref:Uncharacterized protein n=1 Tax=Trichonephila inaurata madagascariensis TaxID=2747483 RepID=A0A8X7BRM2_9ARAC|nr:hypothetical protein TNIN_299331 [Trichonephila inaurata madagascariensis]